MTDRCQSKTCPLCHPFRRYVPWLVLGILFAFLSVGGYLLGASTWHAAMNARSVR